MKCHCGNEMRQTGERLGPSEFYVCLNCNPEYRKQVEDYEAFCKRLWAKHESASFCVENTSEAKP